MKDTIDHIRLQVGLFILFLRNALEKLESYPWFPRRKVLAAGLAALVTQIVTQKLGLDVGVAYQGMIDGAAAAFIGWLVPEREVSLTQIILSHDDLN